MTGLTVSQRFMLTKDIRGKVSIYFNPTVLRMAKTP